jgi:diguanylate cyclase (GGDEF)-like protein
MRDDLKDYKTLVARLKENDELARKFFEIQTSVLATLNFDDLFSKLLNTIKEKFGVPYVWLSLVYPSRVTTLVNRLACRESINRVTRDELVRIVGGGTKPVLINKHLERVYCLLPGERFFDFNSIAITPITLDGELIGSFNQADPSAKRFNPNVDPSFLAQLGVVVSICLSNVVAHEELQTLAFKDPLTGLLNRRAMERILKWELARAKRYGSELSLVFVDLDDFKPINDRFGHDRGDELLVYVAATFTDLSRESDIIARFAGDEFVLILPGVSAAEARAFMERLRNHFKTHPLQMEGTYVPIRFSFGVASCQEIDDTPEFLKRADSELYKAKKCKVV